MARPATHPHRRPQARVLRNDVLVLDAAVAQLAERGWSAFSLKAVADRCHLSHQAVQDRYPDRLALAAGLYRARLGPALDAALADLLAAHGLADAFGDPLPPGGDPWATFQAPSAELIAAVEVAILAQFEELLRDAVMTTTAPLLRAWRRAPGPPAAAAQRAYLVIRALGLILLAPLPGSDALDLAPLHADLRFALAHPAAPHDLPLLAVDALPALTFDTGHPLHDQLLAATLRHVATHGFHGASLADIVADVGVTKGFAFARYPTKLALFIDATRSQHAAAVARNVERQRSLARRLAGGIAEAAHLRETQRPELAFARALELEQLRLTWREAALQASYRREVDELLATLAHLEPAAAAATQHVGRAVGEGAVLHAFLDPEAWQESYEIVTIPLHAAEVASGHAWLPTAPGD
jgi:AcrR family transcriptional regulator